MPGGRVSAFVISIPGTGPTPATVWASVEPLSGREALIAAQLHASTTHKIVIRYQSALSALTASWRILWGTRAFDITERRNLDERNRTLELICVEGLEV